MDHQIGCHTDVDFPTPTGGLGWIERRNIAPKCRLPKPAILRTIDALGRRLEGRVACVHGDAIPTQWDAEESEGRFLPALRECSAVRLVCVRFGR